MIAPDRPGIGLSDPKPGRGCSDWPADIAGLADALGIDPDEAFGKLFRVWSWFDQHTETGNAHVTRRALLDRYIGVTGFADAMQDWLQPEAMYVVDVHGSIVHRTAIIDGLKASSVERSAFRWLYDPIVEFAGDRGDQHAGGVETAMVELANPDLVDRRWWPARIDELAAQQMDLETAVELTPDLTRFIEHVGSHSLNGIVGDVRNYYNVDAATMLARMLEVTRADLKQLAGV